MEDGQSSARKDGMELAINAEIDTRQDTSPVILFTKVRAKEDVFEPQYKLKTLQHSGAELKVPEEKRLLNKELLKPNRPFKKYFTKR